MSNDLNSLKLPSSNPHEDLETISRNKLSLLLEPSLFELRPEFLRDKGNDVIIEIKNNGSYTNFRFVVQIKATESVEQNSDDSFSYPIEVSNINYLLNYGMPSYYVLYHHKTETFYATPVGEAYKRLIEKHHPEKLPDTFSVRFTRQLTNEYIKEIYQSTLDNGLLLRRLNPHLKLSTPPTNKTKGIVIDELNEVYSVDQNIEFIEKFGFSLVNQSRFKQIIEIEQRSHPRTEASPTFNLICGIAYFQRSNLYKALELLRLAQQKSEGFDIEVKTMLNYTIVHARYLIGMLSREEFNKQISSIMHREDLGSFLRLEKVNRSFYEEDGEDSVRLKKLYKDVTDIIKEDETNYYSRITGYAFIIDAESNILISDLKKNFTYFCGRVKNPLKSKTYKEWIPLEGAFIKRLNALLKYCTEKKYFLGSSNLCMTKAEWIYRKTFLLHMFTNWDMKKSKIKTPLNKKDKESLLKHASMLEKISETYVYFEHKENFISCLYLKYELLIFINRKKEAAKTAQRILEVIEENDLQGLRAKHNRLISGGTFHEEFMRFFRNNMNQIIKASRNSDIDDKYIFEVFSDKHLAFMENRTVKWSINKFLEFKFPKK